jgi:hypothetical protein
MNKGRLKEKQKDERERNEINNSSEKNLDRQTNIGRQIVSERQ